MSSSNIQTSPLYDSISSDYDAVRSTHFTVKHEEPLFWKLIGDIQQKDILDLACGSGHYSRKIKEKGAKIVVGVDISERMIATAQAHERNDDLGIQYYVSDAASFSFKENSPLFDIVTAQYLLCHAESKECLKEFCKTAFDHLKPGGHFIATSSIYCKEIFSPDNKPTNGCLYQPKYTQNEAKANLKWYDGMPITVTLFSADMGKSCSLLDHAWFPSTIKSILMAAGFASVHEHRPAEATPVSIFVAYKT